MTEDSRAPGGSPLDDRRGQTPDAGNTAGQASNGYAAGRPQMAPPDSGPRSPYGAPLRTDAPGPPRPAFTPHQYEPPQYQQPYGQQQQPPPQTAPHYGGWNTQTTPGLAPAPNWAPVPAPEQHERRGPGMSLFLIVSVVVALVAGALGAGIGVLASGGGKNDRVDLGGGTSASGTKNRDPGSVAGIAQRVAPSVVMIKVTNGTEGGAGTGFVVHGGYIVTNNHVVAPALSGGNMQVVFSDSKTTTATVVGHDPNSDIAVIKPATLDNRKALTLGNSDSLAVGDPVIAIGSPLGLAGTVTTGIVSALNRPVSTSGEGGESAFINAVQTDAAINPGNSGGPLVDSQGRVIGVNSAIATLGGQSPGGDRQQSGNIGLGFAIPSNQVKTVAEQLIKGGKVMHPIIGACMDTTFMGSGARIDTDGSKCKGGSVLPGGPAQKAGLKAGDVITSFDGKPITSSDELVIAIRSKQVGQRVTVVFTRGNQRQTTVVTIGAGE
jgi:putative serine protease PepD